MIHSQGRGTVALRIRDNAGETRIFTLHDVLYVPDMHAPRLFSAHRAANKGATVTLSATGGYISHPKCDQPLRVTRHTQLYCLDWVPNSQVTDIVTPSPLELAAIGTTNETGCRKAGKADFLEVLVAFNLLFRLH